MATWVNTIGKPLCQLLPLARDEIGMTEPLGVIEHRDHRRRHAEDTDIHRSRHGQGQGVLRRILPHEQAQRLLRFGRIDSFGNCRDLKISIIRPIYALVPIRLPPGNE